MKFKTRIIIAFCIIIILPIALACIALWGFYKIESRILYQNYGYESDDAYGIISGSLQLQNRYTQQDYEKLLDLAETDPAQLEDIDFLTTENADLEAKSSFLIYRQDGEIVYNGYDGDSSLTSQDWIDLLPTFGTGSEDENEKDSAEDYSNVSRYYLDGNTQALVKQVDFTSANGGEGSIFIITSSESILPEIRQMLIEMGIAVVLILALTAGSMSVWLYRSMIGPMRKLQTATQNIREGNLDFEIGYDGDDEMGELCRNFEDMRKRLKESTEEKIVSEKENRALISNIAHDLKTPITAVKGYSEGIIDGVADTPEKMDRYIRTIYNKANEMDHLINELSLYSKIDTNRIPYNFNKINVADYFNDCIEEIGLDLETKHIGLSYMNYADRDVVIIADPEQLMRVVNNIINNAVKYMDKSNGQINIRIKDVGDFVQVEIEDNGKGIGSKDLPYIFDRFYRTDSSRNSSTGGSGIGLSIVKKIIEDHGGKIWATSREGTGTTMYFVIRKYQEVPNE